MFSQISNTLLQTKKYKSIIMPISILERLITKFISFGITLVFLTRSEYAYATWMSFMLFSSFFFEIYNFGLSKGFNRYYETFSKKKYFKLIINSFYFNIIFFLISLILLYLFVNFYPFLIKDLKYNIIFYSILLGFSISLDENLIQELNVKKYFTIVALYQLLRSVILILLCYFFFIKQKFDIFEFILIFVYFSFFSSIFLSCLNFVYKLNFGSFNNFNLIKKKEIFNILKFIYPFFILVFLIYLKFSISKFIILTFLSIDEFAYFMFHSQMCDFISIFFISIHYVFRPYMTEYVVGKKFKLLETSLLIFVKNCILFSILYLIFLNYFGFSIFNFIKEQFYFNPILSFILSLNALLFYIFVFSYEILIILDQKKKLFKIIFLSLLVNLFLTVLSIKFIGIYAPAISSCVGNLILLFLIFKNIIKNTNLNLYSFIQFIFWIFFYIFGFCIFYYLRSFDLFLNFNDFIKEFLIFFIFGLLFNLLLKKISIYLLLEKLILFLKLDK